MEWQLMMPAGDRTPDDFGPPRESLVEVAIKKPIRRYGYPLYNSFVNQRLSRVYGRTVRFHVDQWLWGQRGNDFETHRRRINQLFSIKGTRILIAGCGTGRDMVSWLKYYPCSIIGVDYFSYARAWTLLENDIKQRFPSTKVNFFQANLTRLDQLPDSSVDIIASDAVFEHLRDLSSVLQEFRRVLRPGGLLYATFGPLWYCWGGDHFSGHDGLPYGYNHLLLDKQAYDRYLERRGPYAHSEHDGRTWIKNGLFSYLQPDEYIQYLEAADFERMFVAAMIEPRAVSFLSAYPDQRQILEQKVSKTSDLLISTLSVIYCKNPRQSQ